MKKLFILIFGCLSLFGCSQSGSENRGESEVTAPVSEELAQQDTKAKVEAENKVTAPSKPAETKREKVSFDFLTDCKSLETWRGAIQGVPSSDTKGIYVMGQCFSNRHYDLIVYSNREIDLGTATDTKKGSIKRGLPGATYYAFEVPKKKAANPEEEAEAFEYVFPAEVKVYKLFEDGWYLVNTKQVTSFEQLGQLKLNTINQKQDSKPAI